MKFVNKITSLIISLLLLLGVMCFDIGAAVLYPVGDWVYEKINYGTEFEIDAYKGGRTTVSTPYSHNDIPITSVGAMAFMSNDVITRVYLNDTITSVQDHAFLDCVNMKEVVIIGNISHISYSAFAGCKSLASINLEDTSISYVSSSCFMDCDALMDIELPETATSINENAFAYCDSLAKVTIPESVTDIHEAAFYNTPNVVIYCYEDSAAHVFAETNSIEYVLLEPPVTYILGDVDNSGDVAIMDATEVQLLIAQLVEPQDEYTQLRADIDSDGVLSIMDATSIQMFIADIEVEYPIGETFEV
ncbi:MAG: leucine-rich repeat protein [Ruminococcus sp.]|nr:leucine-rich repeat protein [Ruminococcus sp.]